MQYPYGLISDTHNHSWSAFATINEDGTNSRLAAIIAETERAMQMVKDRGGTSLFHAGDLFHVRGEIKPSVFNPTERSFRKMLGCTAQIIAIPGNHDLEGDEADELGNAMQTLANISNFHVCTQVDMMGDVFVFPWCHDLDVLRSRLKKHADPTKDAIIHAPVDGVLKGIPSKSLSPSELAAMGYRRVFAGHYHNHVSFLGGKVVSIGASTHQTWSDPGSTAGFILVYEDRIEHIPTGAPLFVDVDFDKDIETQVRGNYCRLKLTDVTEKELKQWRVDLEKFGALGVNLIVTKKATNGRPTTSAAASTSIDVSVANYIKDDMKPFLLNEVTDLADEVLQEARA